MDSRGRGTWRRSLMPRVVFETVLQPTPQEKEFEVDGRRVSVTRWHLPASVVNAAEEDDINEVARAAVAAREPNDTYCGLEQLQLPKDHPLVVDDVERELNAALASDVGWLPNTLDFTPDPAQVDSKAANGKKDWPAMKSLLQEQRAKFMEDAHIRLLEAGDNHAAVAKARKKSLDELPSWRSGLVGRIRCIQTVKLEGPLKKKRKLREPVSKSKATELARRHTDFWGARLRGEEHLERMRVKLFFPMYGYGANTELPRNGWCDAAPLADPMKP